MANLIITKISESWDIQ